MNPLELLELRDVQAEPDDRGVLLDQVGIADLRYPVVVANRAGERQQTITDVAMDVDLPAAVKGTHMSRFIEVLHEQGGELTPSTAPRLALALQQRLNSSRARVNLTF